MLSTTQITIGSLLFVTFSIGIYYITKKKKDGKDGEDGEDREDREDGEEQKKE